MTLTLPYLLDACGTERVVASTRRRGPVPLTMAQPRGKAVYQRGSPALVTAALRTHSSVVAGWHHTPLPGPQQTLEQWQSAPAALWPGRRRRPLRRLEAEKECVHISWAAVDRGADSTPQRGSHERAVRHTAIRRPAPLRHIDRWR